MRFVSNIAMSFSKKVVIVTGASSGIGAATAKLFAKEGADVIIVGRNETKLAAVTSDITKIGKKPLVMKADVTNEVQAKKIIYETIAKFGKLDVLVNNAGFSKSGTLLGGDILESYDEVMATNLRAAVHLTSLAAPHLIKTKGNIVNISSVAGTATPTVAGHVIYASSKAALSHFSRGAAFELSAHGVRVNIVSPGPVVTDFFDNAGMNINIRDSASMVPLKRVTESEEIADVILFLASEKAKGITGSEFVSDDGYLLGSPVKSN